MAYILIKKQNQASISSLPTKWFKGGLGREGKENKLTAEGFGPTARTGPSRVISILKYVPFPKDGNLIQVRAQFYRTTCI
jgi:hypothetical protein